MRFTMTGSALVGLFLFGSWAGASAAGGAASDWVTTEQSQVRIIAAGDANGRAPIELGIQVRLEPGWKIYWRSPGDAGLPPEFDWSGSHNLAAAIVQWPAPHRFRLNELETFGYTDQVVFPVEVRPDQSGVPVSLRLAFTYGICREVCIPYEAQLSLDLPAQGPGSTVFASLIAKYAARVPQPNKSAGLDIGDVKLVESDGRQTVRVEAHSTTPFSGPDLLIEGPAGLSFGAPDVVISANGRDAVFHSIVTGAKPAALGGRKMTLTVVDGDRSVERILPSGLGRR